jgi:hypothetical protein
MSLSEHVPDVFTIRSSGYLSRFQGSSISPIILETIVHQHSEYVSGAIYNWHLIKSNMATSEKTHVAIKK